MFKVVETKEMGTIVVLEDGLTLGELNKIAEELGYDDDTSIFAMGAWPNYIYAGGGLSIDDELISDELTDEELDQIF